MSGKASQFVHDAACDPHDHGAGEGGKLCDPHDPLALEVDRLQRYLEDAVQVRNQRWADAKKAKADLRAAAAKLADLEELGQRTVDVADEAFGPFPVQTPAEAMTAIEKGIFEQRQRAEAMRAELEFAKLVTTKGITAVERQLHLRITAFLEPKP